MHQPTATALLALLTSFLAATTTTAATPLPNNPQGIYQISSELVDATTASITKRGAVDRTSCFGSGAYMTNTYLTSGIAQWCKDHDGMSVPKDKSLNAQYGGLPLVDGSPGVFAAHYTNDKVETGWVIYENDCKFYMNQVVQGCQGGSDNDSQGGYVVDDDLGSVWVDPNAA